VQRMISHQDVLETLTELFCEQGVPVHLRSDNGPEFTAKKVREWLDRLAIKLEFPRFGGHMRSFN
jgi:putative transposase